LKHYFRKAAFRWFMLYSYITLHYNVQLHYITLHYNAQRKKQKLISISHTIYTQ